MDRRNWNRGFSEDASRHALSATSVDIEAAVDLLLDEQWRSLFQQSKEREDAVDEKMRHEEKANADGDDDGDGGSSSEDVGGRANEDGGVGSGDTLEAVVLDVLPKRGDNDTSVASEDVGEREKSRVSTSSALGASKETEVCESATSGQEDGMRDEKKVRAHCMAFYTALSFVCLRFSSSHCSSYQSMQRTLEVL